MTGINTHNWSWSQASLGQKAKRYLGRPFIASVLTMAWNSKMDNSAPSESNDRRYVWPALLGAFSHIAANDFRHYLFSDKVEAPVLPPIPESIPETIPDLTLMEKIQNNPQLVAGAIAGLLAMGGLGFMLGRSGSKKNDKAKSKQSLSVQD